MEFNKVSPIVTVSRSVSNGYFTNTIRLYQRTEDHSSLMMPGDMTYEYGKQFGALTGPWLYEDSDAAGQAYYIEAVVEGAVDAPVLVSSSEWKGPYLCDMTRSVNLFPERMVYYTNRNSVGAQQIRINFTVTGYKSTPTFDCDVSGILNGTMLTIPYDAEYGTVTVRAWIAGRIVRTVTLTAEDRTDKPDYYGTAHSQNDLDYLMTNYISDGRLRYMVWMGDEPYSKGFPIYYDGEKFVALTDMDSDLGQIQAIFLEMVTDVTRESPISTGVISWFNQIVVDKLIANNIVAKNVQVGTKKDNPSDQNMVFEARTGSDTEPSTFVVTYGGKELFKVNPNTGDIYFGPNFMYKSENDEIISPSSGSPLFRIESNGTLHTVSAVMDQTVMDGLITTVILDTVHSDIIPLYDRVYDQSYGQEIGVKWDYDYMDVMAIITVEDGHTFYSSFQIFGDIGGRVANSVAAIYGTGDSSWPRYEWGHVWHTGPTSIVGYNEEIRFFLDYNSAIQSVRYILKRYKYEEG